MPRKGKNWQVDSGTGKNVGGMKVGKSTAV